MSQSHYHSHIRCILKRHRKGQCREKSFTSEVSLKVTSTAHTNEVMTRIAKIPPPHLISAYLSVIYSYLHFYMKSPFEPIIISMTKY